MDRTKRNTKVRNCARPQQGLFNHCQAMAAGYTRDSLHRAVARGEYDVVLPRVYRIGGLEDSWERRALAAHLWAGEPSAISFASAAAARGHIPKTEPIHVSTTKNLTTPAPHIVVHRIDRCLKDQIESLGPLPLTTEARTTLDLAGIGHPKTDWVLDAGLRNGTPIAAYAILLDDRRMRGKRGVARLGRKLEERDPSLAPTESAMEDLAMRHLRRAGLELPRTQWPEMISTGPIRIDLAWPNKLFAVELDSAAWHLNLASLDADRARDAELGLKGWYVARFTATRLRFRPDSFIETVRYHLSTRPSVA
ncbi:MAG: endonuclease domain-containing protein [Actinomycetota bacterium]